MKIIKITYGLILSIFVVACTKDLIVKDIKDAPLTVLAPANNTRTPLNAITFWWEHVDGAEKYNIQIVKPNFGNIQSLIADTNVAGNKYTRSLTPGVYQWRIRAYNGGGNTSYYVYNLTIDTTSDLSTQLVVPISPQNGFLTGDKKIFFSWSAIPSATNYQFQLMNGLIVLKDTMTTKSDYTFAVSTTTGGVYFWKVKAFNNSSVSQFNAAQTFTIDLRAPNPPVLTSPATLSAFTGTADLKWTRNTATSNDVRYDSIYVAIDSTFGNFTVVSARVNGLQINTSAFTPSLQPSSTPSEYYFWRVRSIDSVGNKSNFSNTFKFHINP
jgi:predicted secreted protein